MCLKFQLFFVSFRFVRIHRATFRIHVPKVWTCLMSLGCATRLFFCVEGVGDFCDSKKLGEIPFQCWVLFSRYKVDCKKATITLWRVRWRRFQRGAGGLKVRFPGDHKVRLQHTKFPLNHGWNVGNLSGMCLTKIMYWYITSGRL